MTELLTCVDLCKVYQEDSVSVNVLNNVSFSMQQAEQVAVLGSSGSGKSTLLHLLGALDAPTSGQVLFQGQDIYRLSEPELASFRNQSLGFVYQFHHLLPEFTALENAAMPLLIRKLDTKQAMAKATELLKRVGLGHRLAHRPSALSGGERQRVAIARALVGEPKLVLADEPTGNLDHQTGEAIYQLLSELRQELSTSFMVVTHDRELAARLDRTLSLVNGQLQPVQAPQIRALPL